MISEVYLGLGSNLGDRDINISRGIELICGLSQNMLVSGMYETLPQGFRNQPLFLNAVCRLWTKLTPFRLMAELKIIEGKIGHSRPFVNAPRSLDIDILLYGQTVLDIPGLTIPHPRMSERNFVLKPLTEIAPNLYHPVHNQTICSILSDI